MRPLFCLVLIKQTKARGRSTFASSTGAGQERRQRASGGRTSDRRRRPTDKPNFLWTRATGSVARTSNKTTRRCRRRRGARMTRRRSELFSFLIFLFAASCRCRIELGRLGVVVVVVVQRRHLLCGRQRASRAFAFFLLLSLELCQLRGPPFDSI